MDVFLINSAKTKILKFEDIKHQRLLIVWINQCGHIVDSIVCESFAIGANSTPMIYGLKLANSIIMDEDKIPCK